MQPSLLVSTSTGTPRRRGLKIRSHDTKKLLQSIKPFISGECLGALCLAALAARPAVVFYGVCHHSPYLEAVVGCDEHRVELLAGGYEPHGSGGEVYAFEGEVAVEAAYGQIAVVRLEGAVYHQYVARLYAFVRHRVARHAAVERCRGVVYELAVEVDGFCEEVLCGRGESGLYAGVGVWQGQFRRKVGDEEVDAGAFGVAVHVSP